MTERQNTGHNSESNRETLFVSERQRLGRVPAHIKFVNGLGALPAQHKNWAFNTLLLLYYSQILGLSPSLASLALAVSLLVDAVSDPLLGAISDNLRSRFGRRHTLMFAAIVPTSLSFYALFAPPQGLDASQLAVWMLTFTVLTRVSFTFFDVPWAAMSAELAHQYEERTSVQTYRVAVGWFIGAAFTFTAYTVLFPPSESDPTGLLDPTRYAPFALIVSLLIGWWMLFTTLGTLSQIPYLAQPTKNLPKIKFGQLIAQLVAALRNRNFRLIFFAFVLTSAIGGTGQVFDVYMNLYFWEFSTQDMRWFIFFSLIGAAAAFAAVGPLQRRFEKQQIVVTAAIVGMVMGMLKVSFRFADIWPENGDPLLLQLLVLHSTILSFAGAMAFIMLASMIPDIVDENEYTTGFRQEGVFLAGSPFATKSTTGLGLFLGGLLLEWVVRLPVQVQPDNVGADVLIRLGVVDGIVVPAFSVIPIVLLSRYRLGRDELETLQTEIRQRKKNS